MPVKSTKTNHVRNQPSKSKKERDQIRLLEFINKKVT